MLKRSLENRSTDTSLHVAALWMRAQMLGWPKEYVGPVLNLLRVFVLHPHVAERYSKEIVEEKRAEEGQTK